MSTCLLRAKLGSAALLLSTHQPGGDARLLPAGFFPSRCCKCRLQLGRSIGGLKPRTRGKQRAGLRAEAETEEAVSDSKQQEGSVKSSGDMSQNIALDKEVSKVIRKTAATFAPRSSTKSKNPATKGTVLYTVFEVQAWVSIVVGFLLSYNLIFPSDRPDIARLLGMWSVWMLAVPSLRARDCSAKEKEALNYLFVLIPVINVLIPTFWKSFPAVFSADCIAMVGMYAWKMDWFSKEDNTTV